MSLTSLPIAEEDLHGFVDGEVDDDKHAAVLAYLAAAPADAARVETWRQQNILLRAAFSQVTLEQVPISLSFSFAPRLISLPSFVPGGGRDASPRQLWRRSLAFTVAAFMAGACIALAVNFSMTRYGRTDPVAVTLAPLARGPALAAIAAGALRPVHAAAAIPQSALNMPGAVAPALAILPALKRQGLQLLRGEVRGKAGDAANCLDFADAAGKPAVLCIAAAKTAADRDLQGLAIVSANALYWRESTSLYALAAPLGSDRLVALARRIHALLARQREP